MTDSSGNTSIIAQCISKPEAGHTDMEFSILWLFLHKIIMHLHISFFSIIIICIDNNKWLIQNLLCSKYSLSGSPGFRAVSRFRKSLRQIIKLLEYIFYFRNFLNTLADHSAKLFFQIFTDNKHYFVKSGFQRIVDGIIHNNLSTWSHRCKLLDSFSKTTSDSCRHNYKCCFLHKYFPPVYLLPKIYSSSCRLLNLAAWSAAIRLSIISSRSPFKIFSSLCSVSLIL